MLWTEMHRRLWEAFWAALRPPERSSVFSPLRGPPEPLRSDRITLVGAEPAIIRCHILLVLNMMLHLNHNLVLVYHAMVVIAYSGLLPYVLLRLIDL